MWAMKNLNILRFEKMLPMNKCNPSAQDKLKTSSYQCKEHAMRLFATRGQPRLLGICLVKCGWRVQDLHYCSLRRQNCAKTDTISSLTPFVTLAILARTDHSKWRSPPWRCCPCRKPPFFELSGPREPLPYYYIQGLAQCQARNTQLIHSK